MAKQNQPVEEPMKFVRDESISEKVQLAGIKQSTVMLNAYTTNRWMKLSLGEVPYADAYAAMKAKADATVNGDLSEAKRMLMSQATVLDAIVHQMAYRAAGLVKNNEDGSWTMTPEHVESILKIAFKAQNQCRATLQTLGELVNPRSVAFIQQANVANGPQQVNNGRAPAQEIRNGGNELLESNPSERLDTRAQEAASGNNQVLEAVGAVNGAEIGDRKSRGSAKLDAARSV